MGVGVDGIRRFPRLIKRGLRDHKGKKYNMRQRMQMKKELGIVPRGFDKLTKKQRKLARLIVDGSSIVDACKKIGIHPQTYYRWHHFHTSFREYFLRYSTRVSGLMEARLKSKEGRAIRIVEDSMENPDPYFRHDVAKSYLTGRGFYKKHNDTKKDIRGILNVNSQNVIEHKGEKPLDAELLRAFTDAMTAMAIGGGRILQPKIIDVKQIKGELPETLSGIDSQMEEVEQQKAS